MISEHDYQVETKVLQIDFSHSNSDIYQTIQNFLAGLDIGVLVNNVGIALPILDFGSISEFGENYQKVINVNITSLVRVSSKNFWENSYETFTFTFR